MIIHEPTTPVPLSQRELSLIAEMADEFLLVFPQSPDVAALREKLHTYWTGDFLDASNT